MARQFKNAPNKDYGIYEVYYTDKGKIEYWTVDPCEPYGETLEELKRDLGYMQKAFSKEVLDYDRLSKQFANRSKSKKKTRSIKQIRS